MTAESLHYTDCGLPHVYLRNGYERHSTSYGDAITIHDLDGLHRAIGLSLVERKARLSGDDVRFLRKELDFPQAHLAQVLGVGETSIRSWETSRTDAPGSVSRTRLGRWRGASRGRVH